MVVGEPAGRRGGRGAGVVAFRRRQHLRRRLHPDHGQGVRARRLHGQLLPLVRHTGSTVRLVLRPAGAVGARVHQQRVGAAADPGDGAGLLVADQPRSDPPARACGQAEPRRCVDGRRDVPGVLAAAEQRPATRTDHRARHPAHLVLGRARGGHQPAASGGDRDHHRSAHAVLRAHGNRGRRRVACRRRAVENHCRRAYFTIRIPGAAGPDPCGGHRHHHPGVPRPDAGRRAPGQFVQVRRRAEPELVRRAHPLRAAVHHQPRRLGGPPLRRADAAAGLGGLGGNVVAQGANSRHRRRARAGASSASRSSRSWR